MPRKVRDTRRGGDRHRLAGRGGSVCRGSGEISDSGNPEIAASSRSEVPGFLAAITALLNATWAATKSAGRIPIAPGEVR